MKKAEFIKSLIGLFKFEDETEAVTEPTETLTRDMKAVVDEVEVDVVIKGEVVLDGTVEVEVAGELVESFSGEVYDSEVKLTIKDNVIEVVDSVEAPVEEEDDVVVELSKTRFNVTKFNSDMKFESYTIAAETESNQIVTLVIEDYMLKVGAAVTIIDTDLAVNKSFSGVVSGEDFGSHYVIEITDGIIVKLSEITPGEAEEDKETTTTEPTVESDEPSETELALGKVVTELSKEVKSLKEKLTKVESMEFRKETPKFNDKKVRNKDNKFGL